MTRSEKRICIERLLACGPREDDFYRALEAMGDVTRNYYDYMTTEPIDCDAELKRLPSADYALCAALLTMLLREDHFCNGAFGRRLRSGQVRPILERMLELLD